MNLLTIVFILAVADCTLSIEFPAEETTAYDYHRIVGIPRARKLRRDEEMNLILDALPLPTIVGGADTDIAEVPYQVRQNKNCYLLIN